MVSAGTWSVALSGLEGKLVEVEASLASGLPRTVIVGLPDTSLNEARDRARAALEGVRITWPDKRVTINLSPASLPKMGSHYDLAVATAVLAAMEKVPAEIARRYVFMGELGLGGQVRRVRGLLPALLAVREAGFASVVIPAGQQREASLVEGLATWPVTNLNDVVELLNGRPVPPYPPDDDTEVDVRPPAPDMADVQGHPDGKWVMEVAAAGRHHVFLHGAPGVGKTMLASRLPGILPELSGSEAIEVSALHSLAGIDLTGGLITSPPFADPHHNSTMASLVGGGTGEIRPGAISLSHRGVLFLDEAPEFGTRLLDALRTPLENGWVSVARAKQTVRFPARFQLVLASNPCPCGHAGVAERECHCAPTRIRAYQERISGPVLDRIDIRHYMMPLKRAFLRSTDETPEASSAILSRVLEARERQARRLDGTPWTTNGEVAGSHLRRNLPLPPDVGPIEKALARGTLTARGVDKVLRLAWTVCDLEGQDRISMNHVRMAMVMRQGETAQAA